MFKFAFGCDITDDDHWPELWVQVVNTIKHTVEAALAPVHMHEWHDEILLDRCRQCTSVQTYHFLGLMFVQMVIVGSSYTGGLVDQEILAVELGTLVVKELV